jgi:hypothetical protein
LTFSLSVGKEEVSSLKKGFLASPEKFIIQLSTSTQQCKQLEGISALIKLLLFIYSGCCVVVSLFRTMGQ